MSTFVSVGNAKQEFLRFFQMIDNVADLLPKPVYVQRGHTQYENEKFDVVRFINMDQFQLKMADATVVILHAGAGSVINAINSKKKPIVIPRLAKYNEHVDDHQLEFSTQLEKKNKVCVVQNDGDMSASIQELLNIQFIQNNATEPEALIIIRKVFKEYNIEITKPKINGL